MWQSKQRDSVTAAVAQKSTAGGFHCVGLWAGGAVRRPTQCGSRRYPRCGPWAGRARGGSHQPFSLALPPSPPACAMGRGGGAVRWECEKKGTADGDGQVASPAQGPAQKCPRCQSPSGASTLGRAHRWQPGQGTQGAQQGSFAMRARARARRGGQGRGTWERRTVDRMRWRACSYRHGSDRSRSRSRIRARSVVVRGRPPNSGASTPQRGRTAPRRWHTHRARCCAPPHQLLCHRNRRARPPRQ